MESLPPEKDRHIDENVSKIHSIRAITALRTTLPVRIFTVEISQFIHASLVRIIFREIHGNIYIDNTILMWQIKQIGFTVFVNIKLIILVLFYNFYLSFRHAIPKY
ncbi:hypothetical protein OO98_24860 [Escherichia coli]|nr:hypothetical protein OO98_24860 [Escherichia coli]